MTHYPACHGGHRDLHREIVEELVQYLLALLFDLQIIMTNTFNFTKLPFLRLNTNPLEFSIRVCKCMCVHAPI